MNAELRTRNVDFTSATKARVPKAIALRAPSSELRAGISLLEVLISMFVMLVGLMGVASLLPVGRIEVQRGLNADLGGACGRAAFRELKIRGILNPTKWARRGGDQVNSTYGASAFDFFGLGPFDSFRAVAIDPLAVRANDPFSANSNRFPYGPGPATNFRLPRLTMGPPFGTAAAIAAQAAMADVVFRLQDDLVFEPNSAAGAPPMQRLQMSGTTPLKRLWDGNYSWLATILPDPDLTTAQNFLQVPMRVSVAVFYKRDLSRGGIGERICTLDTTGPIVEDSVRLKIWGTSSSMPADWLKFDTQYSGLGDGAAHLDIKAKRWVLLAGQKPSSSNWYYAWHRVAAVDDIVVSTNPVYGDSDDRVVTVTNSASATSSKNWFRNITLVGPFTKSDSPILPASIIVILLDDVIDVYERDLTLEEN